MDASWRLLDGDHDSFDMSCLPADDEPVLIPLPSDDLSSTLASQSSYSQSSYSQSSYSPSCSPSCSPPASQSQSHSQPLARHHPNSFSASHHSIRDFAKHHDDDHVILREPFRPTLKSSLASHPSLPTPEPQFRMPLVHVHAQSPSASTLATLRPAPQDAPYLGPSPRRRQKPPAHSSPSPTHTRQRRSPRRSPSHLPQKHHSSYLLAILSSPLVHLLAYISHLLLLALPYAKYPLGFLLAMYLCFLSIIMVHNTATRSIVSVVSPMCRIPAAGILLPVCAPSDAPPRIHPPKTNLPPTAFDDLIKVNAKFEQVLEKNAGGGSLSLELKRSEIAVRDLRTVVTYSSIPARHDLIVELDAYADAISESVNRLSRFSVRVGATVDIAISVNRCTSRYIHSLAPATDDLDRPRSLLASFVSLLMAPLSSFLKLQPSLVSEQALAYHYIDHTSYVSDRVAEIIREGQSLLNLLREAEAHLKVIFHLSTSSTNSVTLRRDEILTSLWTKLGGNSVPQHKIEEQLYLLRQVDSQRASIIHQLSSLLLELVTIQANLDMLRRSVTMPESLSTALHPATRIPLSAQVDTIDRGIEKLQAARSRIRATDDVRMREAAGWGQ